jgi:hypothetical protein
MMNLRLIKMFQLKKLKEIKETEKIEKKTEEKIDEKMNEKIEMHSEYDINQNPRVKPFFVDIESLEKEYEDDKNDSNEELIDRYYENKRKQLVKQNKRKRKELVKENKRKKSEKGKKPVEKEKEIHYSSPQYSTCFLHSFLTLSLYILSYFTLIHSKEILNLKWKNAFRLEKYL